MQHDGYKLNRRAGFVKMRDRNYVHACLQIWFRLICREDQVDMEFRLAESMGQGTYGTLGIWDDAPLDPPIDPPGSSGPLGETK